MLCPSCRAESEEEFETCFTCGAPLRASPADLVPGSVVASRYEILRLLGQGGMGMVFQAHDRVLDEVIALKTLRSNVAREPAVARRFLSEIKLARRARHENVCAIHEYGEDGGLRYIAMEYIEGVDLRRLLRAEGRLPPAEAFDVVIQVAQGLQAIHEAGIIHRDLKTPNIMRDTKGVVRLMDFGIAKRSEAEVTLGGQVLGTPEYMSPEQARGQRVTFQSDIYALGILTFEVFTGRVPFHGDSPVATILMQLSDEPPLDGKDGAALPPEIVPVLAKALAKAPADRYRSAQEMVAAVQAAEAAYLGRTGSPARPTRTLVRAVDDDFAASVIDAEGIETWPQPAHLDPTLTSHPSSANIQTVTTPPVSSTEQAPNEHRARASRLAPVFAAVAVAALFVATRARDSGTPLGTTSSPGDAGASVPATPPSENREPESPPAASPTSSVVPTVARPSPSRGRSPVAEPLALPMDDPEPQPVGASTPEAPPSPEPAPTPPPTPTPLTAEPTVPRPGMEIPRLDPVKPDPRNRGATYPREGHPAGTDVPVYLKVVISDQGVVTDVNAISGAEPFATAAIEAAWAWRFAPPTVGGRPSGGFTILRVVVRPDGS